jgi:uncharacterized protein (TIGR03435 family)
MNRQVQSAKTVLLVIASAVISGLAFGAAAAQSEAPRKSFEVASIKPSAAEPGMVRIGISPGGRYTASGVTVRMLIQQAYDVREFQISGGPGWLGSDRFDIAATADTPNVDRELIKGLLQSLLAERFGLQLRRETKELPIYALVVGKDGHRLHKSEIQPDAGGEGGPAGRPQPGSPESLGRGADGNAPAPPKGSMVRMGRGQVSAQMATLSAFASLLGSQLGRPVLEKTGLTGYYDFDLAWTPEETEGNAGLFGQKPPSDAPPIALESHSTGPSIFTAVREQLGLRLESQKGPVEILVIDRVEKPSEN